jgi:Fe-S-cluster-containing hydrogenase component 2
VRKGKATVLMRTDDLHGLMRVHEACNVRKNAEIMAAASLVRTETRTGSAPACRLSQARRGELAALRAGRARSRWTASEHAANQRAVIGGIRPRSCRGIGSIMNATTTFNPIRIDEEKCVRCDLCDWICPGDLIIFRRRWCATRRM